MKCWGLCTLRSDVAREETRPPSDSTATTTDETRHGGSPSCKPPRSSRLARRWRLLSLRYGGACAARVVYSYMAPPNSTRPIPLELIEKLPKTDLHVHLDGSLRISTILRLAE